MPRGTIMIISILAILMLTSSLMGFVANISVDTNYDGEAYIEIENSSTHEVVDRIPNGYGETFEITTTSNNTQQSCDLPSNCGYIATVHASKEVNPIITVTDTDSMVRQLLHSL